MVADGKCLVLAGTELEHWTTSDRGAGSGRRRSALAATKYYAAGVSMHAQVYNVCGLEGDHSLGDGPSRLRWCGIRLGRIERGRGGLAKGRAQSQA